MDRVILSIVVSRSQERPGVTVALYVVLALGREGGERGE
jgi:hypothetical protein